MLQIRLTKPATESGGSKSLHPDAVTVACPDHLVIADLPVAKSLGSTSASAVTKILGRRSRRQLGERVHFCALCEFPIAVYGRLNPCEHVFCLDCARRESQCVICEERIQKIQTIKMMEGIYICAAPHCLKSFLKKSDFGSHILQTHADLVNPGAAKEGNDLESGSTRKPADSESTVQAPSRPLYPSHPNSEAHRLPQTPRPIMPPSKPMQSFPLPQIHNHPSEQVIDTNAPPGFDRMVPLNRFGQQGMDSPLQPPKFPMPMMMNPGMPTPQYGYPNFFPDGSQPVFSAPPYDMARPESAPESGSGQGSLNSAGSYPRPWNMAPGMGTFEQTPNSGQGSMEGIVSDNNASDPQGRPAMFQGDYGRSPRQMASLPSPGNKGAEGGQSGTSADNVSKGMMAPLPPPPPFPQQVPQQNRGGQFFSDETNSDGQGFP